MSSQECHRKIVDTGGIYEPWYNIICILYTPYNPATGYEVALHGTATEIFCVLYK
jgi:hypothetical protein